VAPIGEVVPAREGLRHADSALLFSEGLYRRSGSSKRRIKTTGASVQGTGVSVSEKWFQQEKD